MSFHLRPCLFNSVENFLKYLTLDLPLAGGRRCKLLQMDWLSTIRGPYATAIKGPQYEVVVRASHLSTS